MPHCSAQKAATTPTEDSFIGEKRIPARFVLDKFGRPLHNFPSWNSYHTMKTAHPIRQTRSPFLWCALLVSFAFVSSSAWAEPAKLAPVLQPFVDDHLIAGAVVLVADAEKVLDTEAVGWMDIAAKKEMRTDCLFWIASMTKPITCTALMMLVDEGKVDVEAEVSRYLPEFKDQMLIVERDDEHVLLKKPARQMLVRDLMSHTSGFTSQQSLKGASNGEDMLLSTRVAAYAAHPLESEPGKKFHYTNGGMNTVGRLVEKVSGMSYAEFLQTRIFDPLGMTDTTFWPTAEQVARLPTGYRSTKDHSDIEPAPLDPFRYPLSDRSRQPMPAGGLFSTAADLAKFCQMILNQGTLAGRRYLSPERVKQMTSRQTAEGIPEGYGFGWTIGGGMIAHAGAWKTNMAIHPKEGLITIFMVQISGWRSEDEGKKIEPAFRRAALEMFAHPREATTAAEPPTKTAPDAKLVIGHADPKSKLVPPLVPPASKEDFIIYKEPGRYGGWPANHGLWQWGDELVVGFDATWYKQTTTDHRIDRSKPMYACQARSLDAGRTWKVESDLPFADSAREAKPAPLTEPLDFTAADSALMFRFGGLHDGPSWFYATRDRCKTWSGPYSFAVEGLERICTRTDLIVLGPRDCLMFGSCAKQNDQKEGRTFCSRTTDGGVTWKLVSLIGPEPPPGGYAIMPSSLRLKSGAIITTIRRSDPEVSGFIECWRSEDVGKTWTLLGEAATHIGGNPPALVQLHDGRLALNYGFRHQPAGMHARLSSDEGRTWGPEILVRGGAFDGDMGYPRSLVRPDGRVLTVYYFNGPHEDDRAIEATLWTAPAPAVAAVSAPSSPSK